MNHNIVYECVPTARYEETDGQWRPSVKILINGQFFQWIEYDLGFDEERFAMPYAREFARCELIRWERSANQVLNAIRYE